eukprot:4352112-Lingulodinium_polyedra.AAC.1
MLSQELFAATMDIMSQLGAQRIPNPPGFGGGGVITAKRVRFDVFHGGQSKWGEWSFALKRTS